MLSGSMNYILPQSYTKVITKVLKGLFNQLPGVLRIQMIQIGIKEMKSIRGDNKIQKEFH